MNGKRAAAAAAGVAGHVRLEKADYFLAETGGTVYATVFTDVVRLWETAVAGNGWRAVPAWLDERVRSCAYEYARKNPAEVCPGLAAEAVAAAGGNVPGIEQLLAEAAPGGRAAGRAQGLLLRFFFHRAQVLAWQRQADSRAEAGRYAQAAAAAAEQQGHARQASGVLRQMPQDTALLVQAAVGRDSAEGLRWPERAGRWASVWSSPRPAAWVPDSNAGLGSDFTWIPLPGSDPGSGIPEAEA